MSLKIYHNPRCSKSRKTLEIIQGAGVEPTIVLYLQDTPAAAEILARELGRDAAWRHDQVDRFRRLAAGYLPD